MREQLRALKKRRITVQATITAIQSNKILLKNLQSEYTHEDNNSLQEIDHVWIFVPSDIVKTINSGDFLEFRGEPRLYQRAGGGGDFSFTSIEIIRVVRHGVGALTDEVCQMINVSTKRQLKGHLQRMRKELKNLKNKRGNVAKHQRRIAKYGIEFLKQAILDRALENKQFAQY